MNIKDYLHLYLGCELEEKVSHKDFCRVLQLNGRNIYNVLKQPQYYKLILRPLSDMSEEESSFYEGYIHDIEKDDIKCWNTSFIKDAAFTTQWLLSKHFDLFGLIEAGLAIDKTTLK